MSARPIQAYVVDATTRYLTDPSFHARVLFAVALTEATANSEGIQIDPVVRQGLLQACVFGVMCAEMNVADTGITAEVAVRSMQATAEAMGMTLNAKPLELSE